MTLLLRQNYDTLAAAALSVSELLSPTIIEPLFADYSSRSPSFVSVMYGAIDNSSSSPRSISNSVGGGDSSTSPSLSLPPPTVGESNAADPVILLEYPPATVTSGLIVSKHGPYTLG